MKKFLKPSYIIIIVILMLVVIIRIALPGIVKNYVNKKLNELPGYTGHVADIDIHLIRGAYVIKGLELRKKVDPAKYPFLTIDHADLAIEWRALFKGRLASKIVADRPVINILATEDLSKEPSKDSWTKTVKALMPITINRLQVNDGRFAYLDFQKKPNVNLHIDHLQLTAINLANVQKAASPLPSTVTLSGTSIGNGHLQAHMKVNVLKDIPDFDMGMQLTGVNLISLNGFLEANVKFDIERGDLSVFSKLKLTNGEMDGYVKPFIKDLKVLNVKKDIKKKGGILRVAKKAIVGLFAKAVENPKTKKIATVAPIKGNIRDPKTSGWQTFLGILKNAFIKALQERIGNEVKSQEPAKKD
ncbi:DUF748 domain-containing protein [Pedobacter sp. L105]|uniref:DUF748 domain-containing protein n=1 Tax=Pedobacter sp. L105 TaxID=1641871 RepID=UPI00131B9F6E|nr:DUF748 domain-containing protein [Pedobacter sp. L105]